MDQDRAHLCARCDGGTRRPCTGDCAAAHNTHHNDVAVYAIECEPATGMAGNGTEASGGGVKFC